MKFQMYPSVPSRRSFLLCGPQAPHCKTAVWFQGLSSNSGILWDAEPPEPIWPVPSPLPYTSLDLVPLPHHFNTSDSIPKATLAAQ